MKQQAKPQTVPSKRKGSRFRFFGQIISELRKAVWPTRQEAIRLSLMVIAVAAAVGIILGATDFGFTQLVNDVFLIGR